MNTEEKINPGSLKADVIGYRALKTLKSTSTKLTVYGVFDHALYLSNGNNQLIKIIKNKEFISSTSILLRETEGWSFKSAEIRNGMEIKVNKDNLVGNNNKFNIDIKNASTWHPTKSTGNAGLLSIEEINLNLRILRDVIYTAPSREGLIPLLENVELYGPLKFFLQPQEPTVSERARPYIDGLMWGLFGGDLEMIIKNVEPILGLGPGLTPSCDDFLAGLILSLNAGGPALFRKEDRADKFFKKISEEICILANKKTTVYSQSLLNDARLGEGPKAILDLVYSLITENTNQVFKISKTVIGMGDTTGADMAIGIFYGIRFLISRIELKELHETA